jgi:glycosyltransferase involved in cell wall biosynthesis
VRVGYLHVGHRQHGVTRYGRLLAAAARACPELVVVESEVELAGDRRRSWLGLWRAAESLADADVIHLQYNNQLVKSVWGKSWAQAANLAVLAALVRAPIVATVHDVPERPRWPGWQRFALARLQVAARRLPQKLSRAGAPRRTGPHAVPPGSTPIARNVQPDGLALWALSRLARGLLVCSDDERRRVQEFVPAARVRTIPHFVESRSLRISADAAKAALGLGGRRVLTLLGYIHPRKGHEILVTALPALPPDVTVVFAGTAEGDHAPYLARLLAMASATGVAERLRVTGYLDERELEVYLAATDLAVCPFSSVSASGSLSTWLSAGAPILASDLPLVAEYNRTEPGAIHTFRPYTADALVQAACAILRAGATGGGEPGRRLRATLGIRSALRQHIEVYREWCGQRAPEAEAAALGTRDPLASRSPTPVPGPAGSGRV